VGSLPARLSIARRSYDAGQAIRRPESIPKRRSIYNRPPPGGVANTAVKGLTVDRVLALSHYEWYGQPIVVLLIT